MPLKGQISVAINTHDRQKLLSGKFGDRFHSPQSTATFALSTSPRVDNTSDGEPGFHKQHRGDEDDE